MQGDHDAILDDLLSRWHSWMHGAKVGRGFNDSALVVGDYLTSRQYDDMNGKLDADLDEIRSRQVDFEVGEMLHPHRTAIYVLARNLCTGHEVWMSPRLPAPGEALDQIVREARGIITARLINAGVI
jgi:hypothetical protein